MTDTPPPPRTAQALKARHDRSQQKIQNIGVALNRMLKSRTAITVAAVAREAGVSRTFLYEHDEAKTLVEQAMLKASGRRIEDRQAAQAAIDAAWKERALNAEEALKAAQAEILAQRRQIGELLGGFVHEIGQQLFMTSGGVEVVLCSMFTRSDSARLGVRHPMP